MFSHIKIPHFPMHFRRMSFLLIRFSFQSPFLSISMSSYRQVRYEAWTPNIPTGTDSLDIWKCIKHLNVTLFIHSLQAHPHPQTYTFYLSPCIAERVPSVRHAIQRRRCGVVSATKGRVVAMFAGTIADKIRGVGNCLADVQWSITNCRRAKEKQRRSSIK